MRQTIGSHAISKTLHAHLLADLNFLTKSKNTASIDQFLSNITNTNVTFEATDSIHGVQSPHRNDTVVVFGAAFTRGSGGLLIDSKNKDAVLRSRLSAAAIVSEHSLVGTSSLSIIIIDQPTAYERLDNSTLKNLASCVIIASVKVNGSTSRPINISLYFSLLDEYKPHVAAYYSCSFYDVRAMRWSESGCTRPIENRALSRYECSCNHLSIFALLWTPVSSTFCKNSTHSLAPNGTCVLKGDSGVRSAICFSLPSSNQISNQIITVTMTTPPNATYSIMIADALSSYITAMSHSSTPGTASNRITLDQIDGYMKSISNVNLTRNTAESILVVQQPNQGNGVIVLGTSFNRDFGGQVVNTGNKNQALRAPLSTAAILSPESLDGVTSLNMLIIDKPTAFTQLQNFTDKKLASSVVLAAVQRNGSVVRPMNISLYFTVLDEYKPNISVEYLCSFYDNRTNVWNESGCTTPVYNTVFKRYECSCNHLTSFALLWLPKTKETHYLDTHDIVSLSTQAFAILCFLIVLIHASITRFRSASIRVSIYQLLPLLSTASSSVLFVFYIALTVTVFTRKFDPAETRCFAGASVLIFSVYFFLIFMFCVKTSISYFTYLRCVSPSSKPPVGKLAAMLIISLFISIAGVSSAAILDFTSSFDITQMYQGKICWFTRHVIPYFLGIPVCLFLLVVIILIIVFAVHLIKHPRTVRKSDRHHSYESMKWCVFVLLASCVTQSIVWQSVSWIPFTNSAHGYVAGWFFILFNGLEGVWSIALYSIIRSKRVNEPNPVHLAETPKEASSSTSNRPKKTTAENFYHGSYIAKTESERKYDSIHEEVVPDNTAEAN